MWAWADTGHLERRMRGRKGVARSSGKCQNEVTGDTVFKPGHTASLREFLQHTNSGARAQAQGVRLSCRVTRISIAINPARRLQRHPHWAREMPQGGAMPCKH